jgi:hypothetical protein
MREMDEAIRATESWQSAKRKRRACIAERADADDMFVAELKRAHERDLVSRYVIETFEKV